MNHAALFAAIAATLYAAHNLADHIFGQTDHQAAHKAEPGLAGWRHIAGHIGLYHLVMAVMITVASLALHLPVTALGVTAGLLFSALTHAVLDRRWPVRWLLDHTASPNFARLAGHGLNGAYLADQALHYGCLWVAALLITCL